MKSGFPNEVLLTMSFQQQNFFKWNGCCRLHTHLNNNNKICDINRRKTFSPLQPTHPRPRKNSFESISTPRTYPIVYHPYYPDATTCRGWAGTGAEVHIPRPASQILQYHCLPPTLSHVCKVFTPMFAWVCVCVWLDGSDL